LCNNNFLLNHLKNFLIFARNAGVNRPYPQVGFCPFVSIMKKIGLEFDLIKVF